MEPTLPGCISVGRTEEDAIRNIREAIELHVEGLKDDGLPVPVEERSSIKVLPFRSRKPPDPYNPITDRLPG